MNRSCKGCMAEWSCNLVHEQTPWCLCLPLCVVDAPSSLVRHSLTVLSWARRATLNFQEQHLIWDWCSPTSMCTGVINGQYHVLASNFMPLATLVRLCRPRCTLHVCRQRRCYGGSSDLIKSGPISLRTLSVVQRQMSTYAVTL